MTGKVAAAGPVLAVLVPVVLNGLAGVVAGGVVLGIVAVVRRLWPKRRQDGTAA
jgi:predicted DNA repair protein MutK